MCSILQMFFSLSFITYILSFFSQLIASDLLIKIPNIENNSGSLHIALYDNSNNFPKHDGKKLGIKKNINEVLLDGGIVLKDLTSGVYAIAIYHDENDNGKFDKLFSFPLEKYGFSNDAPVFFGPPSFKKASFELKKNENFTIFINLR